jgi:GT2 family glycosyltransferase
MFERLKRLARPGVSRSRPLRVVSATRMTEEAFWAESALGQSLAAHGPGLVVDVAFENRRGLPSVYNDALARCRAGDLVLFVHDDLWLDDPDWRAKLEAGLQRYDVIGVAGNRRRQPGQPGWAFLGRTDRGAYLRDDANISGAIREGERPGGDRVEFGPAPADCELLDGVFIACNADALRRTGTAFDEAFAFHFYDLDFCRTARAARLRLGTWPIDMTHQSAGHFESPAWYAGYERYLAKWGESPAPLIPHP